MKKIFDLLVISFNWFFAYQLLINLDLPLAYLSLVPAAIGLNSCHTLFVKRRKELVAFLKGVRFAYDPDTFCRGWLITGSTGSGKTVSGLMRIAHLLYTFFPNWGGLVIDPKCVLWIAFQEIAKHYGKENNFINLAVSLDNLEPKILQLIKNSGTQIPKEKQRYNLASYPGMTWATKAKIVVDTASSVQGSDDKAFFKTQAGIHIAKCLESLQEIQEIPRFSVVFRALTSTSELNKIVNLLYRRTAFEILEYLRKFDADKYNEFIADAGEIRKQQFHETRNGVVSDIKNENPNITSTELSSVLQKFHSELNPALLSEPVEQHSVVDYTGISSIVAVISEDLWPNSYRLALHWEEKYLIPADDQLEGIKGTITNYLQVFSIPEIEEIFSSDQPNTIEFDDIDKGKIICVSMPQKFQAERDYIFTFLKLTYYQHALNRFDYKWNIVKWLRKNLLCFIADEAQGVVTANEDGLADHNVVDKIREALCTVVFATQSKRSLLPRLKKEHNLEVLLLNLKNQMTYQSASKKSAVMDAEDIGEVTEWKRSYSYSRGGKSVSEQERETYIIKPPDLRKMKIFECVVTHAEGENHRVVLPPLDDKGQISERYLELLY